MDNNYDNRIKERLIRRDQSVLSEIERRYSPRMRRIAFNISGMSAQDADECINDVLLEVWNTLPPADPESVCSYVCMLMRRKVIDRLRAANAEKRGGSYAEICDELEDACGLEDSVVLRIAVKRAVDRFLGGLGRTERELFIRRYFEFEELDSISKETGIRKNTIVKKLSRMRAILKKQIEKEGYKDL